MSWLKEEMKTGCFIPVIVKDKATNKVQCNAVVSDSVNLLDGAKRPQIVYALWDSEEPVAWLLIEKADGSIWKPGQHDETENQWLEVVVERGKYQFSDVGTDEDPDDNE